MKAKESLMFTYFERDVSTDSQKLATLANSTSAVSCCKRNILNNRNKERKKKKDCN